MSIKTGSSGLVICVSKSPRRFLGLDLKTKRASIYRLRHKTDGARSERDTHRDLTACFVRKQVGLGFPRPQDWRSHDSGWCTWHHHGGCVESKLKMDESMRQAASDPATLALPVSFY
jgi:hypothetical protein